MWLVDKDASRSPYGYRERGSSEMQITSSLGSDSSTVGSGVTTTSSVSTTTRVTSTVTNSGVLSSLVAVSGICSSSVGCSTISCVGADASGFVRQEINADTKMTAHRVKRGRFLCRDTAFECIHLMIIIGASKCTPYRFSSGSAAPATYYCCHNQSSR